MKGPVLGCYNPEDDPTPRVSQVSRLGYLTGLSSVFFGADNLHEYAIGNVGSFDRGELAPLRSD